MEIKSENGRQKGLGNKEVRIADVRWLMRWPIEQSAEGDGCQILGKGRSRSHHRIGHQKKKEKGNGIGETDICNGRFADGRLI